MPSVSQAPLSGRYLSFVEREEVALLRTSGCGVRAIARHLHRAPSTISREVRRNAATRGGYLDYRALTAQWHADRRARRPKVAKLAVNDALREYVQDRLAGGRDETGRHASRRSRRTLDRSSSRATPGPALGDVLEP
jgi:IS30 family transposase